MTGTGAESASNAGTSTTGTSSGAGSASDAGTPAGIPKAKETSSLKTGTWCSTRSATTHFELSKVALNPEPLGTNVGS